MTGPLLSRIWPPCQCARCRPDREKDEAKALAALARWRALESGTPAEPVQPEQHSE